MNRNLILAGLGALVAAATLHLGAPSAAAAPAFCAKHSPTHYITACATGGGGGGAKPVLCPEPCETPDGGEAEAASSTPRPLRDALRKALNGGTSAPSTSTGSTGSDGGGSD